MPEIQNEADVLEGITVRTSLGADRFNYLSPAKAAVDKQLQDRRIGLYIL